MTSAPTGSLPDGFTVALSPRVRVYDGGRTLVGGAPARAVFLSGAARRLLEAGSLTVTDELTRALGTKLIAAGVAHPVLDELPPIGPDELTVVVPVRDREAALERLLTALRGAGRVVVVDDASADARGVADCCRRHQADLLRLSANVGPAEARNHGLRMVRTRYVAFVDSDVVVAPGTLTSLLRHFHDPRLALVGPRIVPLDSRGGWLGRYEAVGSSLDRGAAPALVRPHTSVAWLPGACLLARVDALGDGFADTRVAEDVDLVWRLVERGWRVRYAPSEFAAHDHRTGPASWMLRKAQYGTGAKRLGQRHGGAVAPAVLAPWSAVLLLCVLAQRRWSPVAAAAVYAAATVRIAARLDGCAHPYALGLRLAARGGGAAVAQGSALLLRHWWPVTLVASIRSHRVRRAAAVAALADAVLAYGRTRPALDPVRFAVARRLDDLAYGAGLWWGCVRGHSYTALRPILQRTRRRARPRPLRT